MIGTQTLATQAPPLNRAPLAGKPLAGHPAFAPALILWFAALFGLSTLAIRGALLESWVIAAKIDMVLPAATPPLGAKSRLLLAVAFAILGAAIGWLAARLLRPALAHKGDEDFQLRQRDRHPDAPARRPISAHAELGDEGLGRASAARDDFLADLPTYGTSPFTGATNDPFAAAGFANPPYDHQPQDYAFHDQAPVPVFATPAPVAPAFTEVAAPATIAPAALETDDADDLYAVPMIDFAGHDLPLAEPAPVASELVAPPQDHLEQAWQTLPPLVTETDLAPVAPIRTITPLRAVPRPDLHLAPVTPPAPPVQAPVETPALIGATPVQPRAAAHERIAHTPLGDLSHVELIERLAMAIHSREKSAKPTAVNDAQDAAPPAQPQAENEGLMAAPGSTQANLRSALASLREVK